MNQQAMRRQLEDAKARLAKVDEEREVLTSLVHGLEGWLRLYGDESPREDSAPTPNVAHGEISMRAAVRKALIEAGGRPIHSRDILSRARQMGAITTGKDAESIVDLNAYSLRKKGEPVEKVAPRTWRWLRGDGEILPILLPSTAESGSR